MYVYMYIYIYICIYIYIHIYIYTTICIVIYIGYSIYNITYLKQLMSYDWTSFLVTSRVGRDESSAQSSPFLLNIRSFCVHSIISNICRH